jgi:transposase-like protein
MIQTEELLAVFERAPSWSWIVGKYLAGRPICPRCGQDLQGEKPRESFLSLERTFCRSCNKKFTPTEGTPLHRTRWQPEEFVRLIYMVGVGLSLARIGKALGKSPESIRDMLERARLATIVAREDTRNPPLQSSRL